MRGQDLNLRPPGYEPDELPDCSTPRRFMKLERETGIEPARPAWKAGTLPLSYSRLTAQALSKNGGGDWIRTSEGVHQQIYSLPPLASSGTPPS